MIAPDVLTNQDTKDAYNLGKQSMSQPGSWIPGDDCTGGVYYGRLPVGIEFYGASFCGADTLSSWDMHTNKALLIVSCPA